MRPITKKIETLRRATAESRLTACPETIARLLSNDLPKKDVFPSARTASILAVKKTPELLPLCHPVPIDWVGVEFSWGKDWVTITVTVEAVAKTGLEMEALTGASVGILTVYDMLKPIDKNIEIGSTKLLSKSGGKSDFVERIPPGFRSAVIVTSDGTFQGKRTDRSGRLIEKKLESCGLTPSYTVLPDDQTMIAAALERLCEEGVELVITTGGTGLGPRDVTVEATRQVIEREVPGILEAARAYGQRRTPYAMLSRGLAGQKGRTLILNLPGSSKGVEESLDALFPAIFHAYPMMGGGGHEKTAVSSQELRA